jgi:ElaB/YqjD/DUF883 family membrane-anchored ribosome-binding protein
MTNTDTQSNGNLVARTQDAVSHAAHSTRDSAVHAIDATRTAASDAAHKAADGIDANPLSALVGGLAIGVAVGALLPRTKREAEILGPVGRRLTDSATAAARAARDAGKQELGALLPGSRDAKDKASSLLGTVVQAARDGARTS